MNDYHVNSNASFIIDRINLVEERIGATKEDVERHRAVYPESDYIKAIDLLDQLKAMAEDMTNKAYDLLTIV